MYPQLIVLCLWITAGLIAKKLNLILGGWREANMESYSTRKSTREVEAKGSCMLQVSLMYTASSQTVLAIQSKIMAERGREEEGRRAWILMLRKTIIPFISENKYRHLGIQI